MRNTLHVTVGTRLQRGDVLHKALLGFPAACIACGLVRPSTPNRLLRSRLAQSLFKQLRLDGNFVRWPRADGSSSLVLTYKVSKRFQAFEGRAIASA